MKEESICEPPAEEGASLKPEEVTNNLNTSTASETNAMEDANQSMESRNLDRSVDEGQVLLPGNEDSKVTASEDDRDPTNMQPAWS